MKRCRGVALAAVATCVGVWSSALAAPVSAQPKPRLLAVSVAALRTDGSRYAAYVTAGGALRLVDTRRRTSRSVPLPASCTLTDGQRGYFLVNCADGAGFVVPRVLVARSGQLVAIPGLRRTYFPDGDDFYRIGTRWLQGTTVGQGHPTTEYLNWRTGQVKDFGEESSEPSVPRDLNSPDLSPIGPSGLFSVYLRHGSLTLFERSLVGPAPLVLRRSRHAPTSLDRCGCDSVSLSSHVITWAHGATAHAYIPRTNRRLAWRFASSLSEPLNGVDSGVQQTDQRLFFNVPTNWSAQPSFRIYTTAAPH